MLLDACCVDFPKFALEDESTKGAEKPDQSESRPASSDPDNLSDDNSPIEANPLWTDDDSQDVAKIWEREQPQEHADVAVAGWQCLGRTVFSRVVALFCPLSFHFSPSWADSKQFIGSWLLPGSFGLTLSRSLVSSFLCSSGHFQAPSMETWSDWANARGAKHESVDMPMDGSTGSSGSADGRLWLEVVDQLQQMCRSIVSSQRFHVHLLQSQNNMTAKMRDFTLSLGDRMQNLSINMKSQNSRPGTATRSSGTKHVLVGNQPRVLASSWRPCGSSAPCGAREAMIVAVRGHP